jgi:hypothetical protein
MILHLGICIIPLGFDNMGREYWKFPTSPDLYIKNNLNKNSKDIDKDNFNNLIIMNEDFYNDGNSDYDSDDMGFESDRKESSSHEKSPISVEKGIFIYSCVCIFCMYIYIYMYIYIEISIYTYIDLCMCRCMDMHTYIQTYVHANM